MKHLALTLIFILAALVAFMDTERRRLIDWFEGQNYWRQLAYGVFLALFITLCLAVVLLPVIMDWVVFLLKLYESNGIQSL